MKRFTVFIAVVAAVAILAQIWWRQEARKEQSAQAEAQARRPATGLPSVPAQPQTAAPSGAAPQAVANTGAPAAAAMPQVVVPRPPPRLPEDPARNEAEALALNLRSYGQRFGGNPVGTNAEIVKTLNGGNPQGVRYLPQQSQRLNAEGELLDPFGTPYFFHQISSQEMEIRSAGPDKTLWTQDDITVK